jgi:ribA/ribD-fused uncharacterized protein
LDRIKEFQGDHRFLSNFYVPPGEKLSLEHVYQALKTNDKTWQELIMAAPSPGEAKRLGYQAPMRPDWEEIKVHVMHSLVYAKFATNDDLKKLLLNTGDAFLEEGNNWGDTFWGVDMKTGEGLNMLGDILMSVRNEIKFKEAQN